MKVKDVMIRDVKSCAPVSSLNAAAQIMWDHDCGCVPVIDQDLHVVGVITDRDICMAAYTQNVTLKESTVSSAMSKKVFTCQFDDDLASAESTMRQNRIRRLPVVDSAGRLAGIISLNDIAREAERERAMRATRQVTDVEVTQVLASVCAPRTAIVLPRAA